MKKFKSLLVCFTLALCTLMFGGCTRDRNNGSIEPGTGTNQNTSATNNESASATNNESTSATDHNNESTSATDHNNETTSHNGTEGVLEEMGEGVETIIDDTATVLDPTR